MEYYKKVIDLIRLGKNDELKALTWIIGPEKVKCNQFPTNLAALHYAAYFGNINAVEFLLSEPIVENPSLSRVNKFTPLHAAAMNGFTEIVALLLRHEAKINAQTEPQLYAPLHSASFGGHISTVRLLVEQGARLDLRNYRGEYPIDTARRKAREHVVQYFERIERSR